MFEITVNDEQGWFLTKQEKQDLDKLLTNFKSKSSNVEGEYNE